MLHHYQYILKVGKAEISVQSTSKFSVGENVGIVIKPDLIHIMKKEYNKPTVDTKEFDVIVTIADLSNGGTMGGVGSNNGGDSTNWDDE